MVDPTCAFVWTTSLDFSLFLTCCWVGAWKNLAECWFFWCSWNFGQSFASYWINFSSRTIYLLSWLIVSVPTPYNRSVAVFSHVGPLYFPCFLKGHFLLELHLKYFFFFFFSVHIARSHNQPTNLSKYFTEVKFRTQ